MQMPGELCRRGSTAPVICAFHPGGGAFHLPASTTPAHCSYGRGILHVPRLTQIDQTGHFTLPVGIDAFTRAQGVELHLWMVAATVSTKV